MGILQQGARGTLSKLPGLRALKMCWKRAEAPGQEERRNCMAVNLQEETEKIEQQYQGELGRIFLKEVTVMQKGPRANEKVCSI